MQYSFRVLDHDKNFSLLLYELLVQPRLQGLFDNLSTMKKKMLISVLVAIIYAIIFLQYLLFKCWCIIKTFSFSSAISRSFPSDLTAAIVLIDASSVFF